MKTSDVTTADLLRCPLALPPMARTPDGGIALAEQVKILDWLRSAGVTTFLYGGCANFFNMGVRDYAATLDTIESLAQADDWVIPTIGPDFGKALDQVAILKDRSFPSAMLLPLAPVSQSGVATGLRRLSDTMGKPLMVFFKSPEYVRAADLAVLLKDGVLCCVEYGVGGSTDDKAEPFLAELLDRAGSADAIIDGAGERTITTHARFGLKGYTSGSGVVAPHLTMALLAAVKRGDLEEAGRLREHFLELEALRLTWGQIPVLHDAVRLAGISDTGPIGPFFANTTDEDALKAITAAATELRAASAAYSNS
ncbi:dihydrodipicolinate synthase family protein [Reyranella sp.]|uniref:dihydrodipicolinate synthase family protein n=1 Tax=Reyranella sp. TaxID=1929291 RepID=UPI003D0EE1A4